MIFAAEPTDPVSFSFGPADWSLLGLAIVGLYLASWALRRGPRETLGFGRPELAGWVVGMGLIGYLVAQPWFLQRPDDPADTGTYFALVGVQRLVVGLIAIGVMRALLAPGNPAGLPAPRRGRPILWGLALYLAVLPFMLLLGRFNANEVTQSSAQLVAESSGAGNLAAMFFCLVIATPLFEEIIFRGFFQGGLRRINGPEVSVGISSLIFMLVHNPPSIWPQVLCLGALLGLVYERTRTLWAPLAIHVLHNGLTFGYLSFFH